MKDEHATWFFVMVAVIFAITGITTKDYLWFVRAGIVLVGGLVYYILVKKRAIGNKSKWIRTKGRR